MSENVRVISHEGKRVETGAVRFGDDWPGLFVRGDDCGYISLVLMMVDQIGHIRNLIESDVIIGARRHVINEAEGAHTSPKSVIDRCRELFEQSTQEERDAYLDREQPEWLKQALTDAYIDENGKVRYHSDTERGETDE